MVEDADDAREGQGIRFEEARTSSQAPLPFSAAEVLSLLSRGRFPPFFVRGLCYAYRMQCRSKMTRDASEVHKREGRDWL